MTPHSADDPFSAATGMYPISIPTPFPVGPVNVFLLKSEPLTLIDVGPRTDDAWDALQAGLQVHGLQISDLERIILTHHHVDHIGMLTRVKEESGAEAWAHPRVQALADEAEADDSGRQQFFFDMMSEFGVPRPVQEESMQLWGAFKVMNEPYHIDHTFDDGGEVGPYRAYYVPGHSACDTLLVHPDQHYTIVGDHLLQVTNPNPLLRRPDRPGRPRPRSLVQFQLSLLRSRQLDLGLCFPGHGGRFDDHQRVADRLLGKHEERNRRALQHIGPEGSTVYEIAMALYPDISMAHLYLALSVASGHLELLEERGVLYVESENEITRYRRVGA